MILSLRTAYNNRLARIILTAPPPPPPSQPNQNDSPRSPPSPLASALLICHEMVSFNIPPTPLTYSLLIQICLLTQSNRSIERILAADDPTDLEEGSQAAEEIRLEREYIQSMTWLERRRKLLWQGADPTGMNMPVRGAWFGSAEFEIGWGFYLDAEARGIKVPREGLDALMKVGNDAHIICVLSLRSLTTFGSSFRRRWPTSTLRSQVASLLSSRNLRPIPPPTPSNSLSSLTSPSHDTPLRRRMLSQTSIASSPSTLTREPKESSLRRRPSVRSSFVSSLLDGVTLRWIWLQTTRKTSMTRVSFFRLRRGGT